jgi:hypothetical protein
MTEEVRRSLDRDFILDVMLIQILRTHSKPAATILETNEMGYIRVPEQCEFGMPHSCYFHEHLVYDSRSCRTRLKNYSNIFQGLIDACTREHDSQHQEDDGGRSMSPLTEHNHVEDDCSDEVQENEGNT